MVTWSCKNFVAKAAEGKLECYIERAESSISLLQDALNKEDWTRQVIEIGRTKCENRINLDYIYGNDPRQVAKQGKKRGQENEWSGQWESPRSSVDEKMRIIVERTFHITDEEQGSIVSPGHRF